MAVESALPSSYSHSARTWTRTRDPRCVVPVLLPLSHTGRMRRVGIEPTTTARKAGPTHLLSYGASLDTGGGGGIRTHDGRVDPYAASNGVSVTSRLLQGAPVPGPE